MASNRPPPWLGPVWAESVLAVLGFLLVALLFILAIGASGCASPALKYVAEDRATYEIVSVEYLRYIARDETMAGPKGQSRQDLVEKWRRRIEEAEGAEHR